MRFFLGLGLLVLLLTTGCQQKKQTAEQAGTATESSFSEVIDHGQGYIIQNAKLADTSETPALVMSSGLRLASGTTSVLVIRGNSTDKSVESTLALQLDGFAPGSSIEYSGDRDKAQFWIAGKLEDRSIAHESGLISGSLRCIKDEWSDLDLGLNRALKEGIGDVEVVVANIDPAGLSHPNEKKYAARFQLPLITLAELIRITRPV